MLLLAKAASQEVTSSGSFGLGIAIPLAPLSADRSPRRRPGPADPVRPPAPRGPTAAPRERRRGRIPVARHRLEPPDDLLRPGRLLPVQRPPLQDPLDALGHVQPRPAQ